MLRSRGKRKPISRRSVLACVVLAVVVSAFVVTWKDLERVSPSYTSYVSKLPARENLALDGYDTLSSIGFFRATAARLISGKTTDIARLQALMSWTSDNVRPQYAAPNRVVSTDAWGVVRRGFGQCDQVNHIFATLATYAGYDARQWFLWTSPQRTRSPHSVAEVRIGSDWVVVDAWQGVLWTDRNGKLLGAQDATQELMDQLGYTRWGIKAEWFKYGTEFRSFPYETPVAFAEKIINKSTTVPVAPPVLPVSTPPSVSGSPVPATPTPSPGASLPTADDLQTYDEARRAQLDGDYGRAAELYQTVLGQSTSSELRDAAILWLGVSLLREGRAASAIEVFNTALATSPSTAWRTSILQFRGNAYEAIGNPEAAESDYITSDTPWSDTRLAKLGIKLLG